MIGQTLGHFRIVEKIGAGGMGVVYRAHDEQLERDVAIKVLPVGALTDDTSRKRFRQEALALSKLNHPNIATLHELASESQVDYLVMEYVAGTTLSDRLSEGPLPEKEILGLGPQLAEGLAAAHEHDVVHRDLKPSNLRITPDGRLKILDFGLAELVRPSGGEAITESLGETRPRVGTLAYMAPEQVSGEAPDPRSDIYAAGAVLYEMATGQRLFPRDTEPLRLMHAILYEAPRAPRALNPRVSTGLESIILKCVEKNPEHRYQSAREILADLRRLSAGSWVATARRRPASLRPWLLGMLALGILLAVAFAFAPNHWRDRLMGNRGTKIRSLAVIPLENLSGDPEQDYFADGMTDALITDLGKIRALRVISRTSVMQYKGKRKPLGEIAKELNVDAAVEGSILRSGKRVQITARLIEAATDTQIWSQSYERDLQDVLELNSKVARAIANEIRVQLSAEEHAQIYRVRAVNAEALDAYLKGRYYWERRTAADLKKSLDFFQKAIELDPTYALAYAGMADTYAVLGNNRFLPAGDCFPKAEAAARKALAIEEGLAEAHASLAFSLWNYDLDWEATNREFKRAIELNPGYATAYHWYSGYLSSMGRHEEAIAAIKKARDLDPLSPRINANVGFILFFARKYDQAIEELQSALQMDPRGPYLYLGMVYTQTGNHAEAISALKKYSQLSEGDASAELDLAYAEARAGHREEARKTLSRVNGESRKRYVPALWVARVYLALGDSGNALSWLEKAYEERSPQLSFLGVDPRFDPLRASPSFRALLRRMKLMS